MPRTKSFLIDIKDTDLDESLSNTEMSYATLNEVGDKIIKSYSTALDDVMQKIYKDIILASGNYDDRLLDQYCLELTNVLYFMQDKLEAIGLKEDISKALAQEQYNKAYLDNQIKDTTKTNKTTVAELTAIAQEESKKEQVVTFIYDRCYKLFKEKIDSGYEMVNSLRKIITKNIQEMGLSRFTVGKE